MPSKEHNELALMGLTWLANKATLRGVRAQTEVTLADGYVADVAAVCSLQHRFWQDYCESGKSVGEIDNYLLCVMEAKCSRGDFLATFNGSDRHANRHAPIGSLHWCIAPPGMCEAGELPDFWGLLTPRGTGLSEVRKPKLHLVSDDALHSAERALLWALQSRRQHGQCARCHAYSNNLLCVRCRT